MCKCNGWGIIYPNTKRLEALDYSYCQLCVLGAYREYYDAHYWYLKWKGDFRAWLEFSMDKAVKEICD